MTVSPEARRAILVAAFDEEAIFDLLRNLRQEFGGDDPAWLAAIQAEAKGGLLATYRHDEADRSIYRSVDPESLDLERLGVNYLDAVYLARTDKTIPAIHTLPPPPPGHSM